VIHKAGLVTLSCGVGRGHDSKQGPFGGPCFSFIASVSIAGEMMRVAC